MKHAYLNKIKNIVGVTFIFDSGCLYWGPLFQSTYILVFKAVSEHIGGKMGVFLDQRRMLYELKLQSMT
jgi:hypothetical protein